MKKIILVCLLLGIAAPVFAEDDEGFIVGSYFEVCQSPPNWGEFKNLYAANALAGIIGRSSVTIGSLEKHVEKYTDLAILFAERMEIKMRSRWNERNCRRTYAD